MLERGTLLVRDGGGGVRAVVDGATGLALGSARPTGAGPRWLPGRPVLEVREAGDAPLLFTVRRGWSLAPRHEVRDAEGRLVGTLAGPRVSGRGRPVAVRGADGAYRAADGRVLARVALGKGGTEVNFSDAVAADPFAKMLLLAAALLG
jgi:hypothetical protein